MRNDVFRIIFRTGLLAVMVLGNLAGNAFAQADTTPPTATLTTLAVDPINTTFTALATFSEPVTGFTASDVVVVNCSVSVQDDPGNTVFTLLVSPAADGLVSLQVPAAAASDAAGNPNTASDTLVMNYDSTPPAVTLTSEAPEKVNAPFLVTATFSELVIDIDDLDFTVVNGSAVVTSTLGRTIYIAQISPASDGPVQVQFEAGEVRDGAGNVNQASAILTRTFDGTPPRVLLYSSAPPLVNAPFTVTAVFSEPVTLFDASDIKVTRGTGAIKSSQGGTTFTLLITPQADGNVGVTIPAGGAQDPVGNFNLASALLTRTCDKTAPVPRLSSSLSNPTSSNPIPVTISFNEPVTGLALDDLVVGGGSSPVAYGLSGSGASYTVNLRLTQAGRVLLTLKSGTVVDAVGNPNTAAATLDYTFQARSAIRNWMEYH